MKLPSASALPRAMACTDSFGLPHVEGVSNVFAQSGTTLHEFLRAIGKGKTKEEALEAVPVGDPGRGACEDVDESRVPRGGHHELALAWDPETGLGRVLGENIGRDYEGAGANRALEFVGSVDYGGVMPEKRVAVIDYKSGWQVIPARDSWQLKGLAVSFAAAAGAEEVVAAHLVLRGTSVRWDMVEWDGMQLAGFREELRDLASRLRAAPRILDLADVSVVEGEHCKYCPAFQRCPAKVGLVRQMAATMLAPAPGSHATDLLTLEDAAKLWLVLDRYDEIAKRLRRELEGVASRTPLDLGGGRMLQLAPGQEKDRIADPKLAVEWLRRNLDEEAALAAIEVSKGGVEGAAKGWARRNSAKVGSTVETVVEKLRAAGIIKKVAGEVKVREVNTKRGKRP